MQSKFTQKERLEIGHQIFERELNQEKAAVQYDISPYTARDYLRLYKAMLAIHKKGPKPFGPADKTIPSVDMPGMDRR